jgi:CelD/BcsL family acetyltransferase involved in cellulose biosynthesis
MSEFNPVYDPVQLEVAGSPARARPSPRSDTLSRAGLRIDVHTDLAAIETEWRGFEERADCTPFQTFAWLSAWQRHIGSRRGTRPAIVVGRDAVGEILFLFPLAVEGDSLRRLTWLGSDLCDYNAPLLAEDFSRAVPVGCFPQLWRQILRSLRGDAKLRFDLVDLSKMPEQVGGQPNPFRQLPLTANPSGAHVADLGDDWDEFYAMKRSSTVRKQERKQLRRLADFGELRVVQAQGPEAVELTLGT